MARRRAAPSGGEVSLFPFLSILACLIGALVLMIVVLVMAQVGKSEGRTQEEIKRAQDYIQMKKDIEKREELDVVLKEKLAQLEELKKQLEERQQRYAKLRRLLDTSKEIMDSNLKLSQQMQKELDDLLVEIEGLKKQMEESKAEIEKLMAEKAELERQLNDLDVLKEQIKKLRSELAVSKRLDWIRRGILGVDDTKGATRLMQTARDSAGSTEKKPKEPRYDLNVEILEDGTVRVLPPATNIPPARTNSP